MTRLREILYLWLEADTDLPVARAVRIFLSALIILNVAAAALVTVASISAAYGEILLLFNTISVSIFGVEYLLRIWVSVEDGRSPFWGRLRFALSPIMLVDLIAILPAILPQDIADLRTIRVFRLLRIFKLSRYSSALRLMLKVLQNKSQELLATAFVGFLLLLVSSTIVYYLESPAQPQVFSSIPRTMWWGMATLTTVGYGDMVPLTVAGQFVGAIVALLGIGMFALPASILASGFVEELRKDHHDNAPEDPGSP